MPCNVAMKSPCAWVVGLESDNDEAVNGEEDDIATWRVVEFGVESGVAVRFVRLLEEGKVVAVEMHLLFFGISYAGRGERIGTKGGRGWEGLTGWAAATKTRSLSSNTSGGNEVMTKYTQDPSG